MFLTRVPPVEPGTKPELAEIEATISAERGGEIPLLYKVLLNSAPIASGWEKLLTAVRNRSTLSPELRELIILRVAVLNRASFEFKAHLPHAHTAGISASKIDALLQPTIPSHIFSASEHLVLDLTDSMTRDVDVPAEIMDRVCAEFDHRTVVELVTTVSAYNMVSRFLVALGITH